MIVVIVIAAGIATTGLITWFVGLNAPQPTKYVSSAFDYEVTMPGKPSVAKPSTASGLPAERIQWNGPNGLTITIEAEQLSNAISSDRLDTVLQDSLAGGAKALKATNTRDQTSYRLDGVAARSIVVDTAIAGTVYQAVAIKGKVVYTIVITHPTAAVERSINGSFSFTG